MDSWMDLGNQIWRPPPPNLIAAFILGWHSINGWLEPRFGEKPQLAGSNRGSNLRPPVRTAPRFENDDADDDEDEGFDSFDFPHARAGGARWIIMLLATWY